MDYYLVYKSWGIDFSKIYHDITEARKGAYKALKKIDDAHEDITIVTNNNTKIGRVWYSSSLAGGWAYWSPRNKKQDYRLHSDGTIHEW